MNEHVKDDLFLEVSIVGINLSVNNTGVPADWAILKKLIHWIINCRPLAQMNLRYTVEDGYTKYLVR